MKDYIEEMMRTTGAEPKYIVEESDKEMKVRAVFSTKEDAISYQSKFGGNLIRGCDFTPTKQLEIIKLISTKSNITRSGITIVQRICNNNWYITTCHKNGIGENQDFVQALAQLTVKLMKAEELNKQKVKEILEG